ncbi:MAG: NrdH-redoxin [Nitrospirae bacterium]|nr:MAG: NrdH-redoxin [Nitrospirota bacterium]
MGFHAVMFTTPTCGYCKKAEQYLKKLDIPVKKRDITKDPRALEECQRRSGGTAVPVILLKGHTIVGFDKGRIDRILGID